MTKARRIASGIIGLALIVAVTTAVVLLTRDPAPPHLSLVFDRYSTRQDFFVQDVAFLWLTNSSAKTFYLGMTGGTNTLLPDTLGGITTRYKPLTHDHEQATQSYMVNCEFSGERKPKLPISSWARSVTLAPNSAIRLRVALPPEGRTQKVAVLCAELPAGPPRFWTNRLGLSIARALPRPVARKVFQVKIPVQKVWCERELSRPVNAPRRSDRKKAAG